MDNFPHYAASIADGYVYECGCGELYREVSHARNCRKCRVYLTDMDFANRQVTDIRTGQPTEEVVG